MLRKLSSLRPRTALLFVFLACSSAPPPTAATSLASLGRHAFLDVAVKGGTLSASLDSEETPGGEARGSESNEPCPTIDAQATLNGQLITVTSPGAGGTLAFDNGCGISGYACTSPAFSGPLDAGAPGAIDLRISDSTAAFELHATMVQPSVAFADPSDGTLRVGSQVYLTITPPPAAEEVDGGLGLVLEFREDADADAGADADADAGADAGAGAGADADARADADASSRDASSDATPPTAPTSFSCPLNSTAPPCSVQITATGISFLVPPIAPGSGVLSVRGFAATTTPSCTGVAGCTIVGIPPASATLATRVAR